MKRYGYHRTSTREQYLDSMELNGSRKVHMKSI